MFHWLMNNKEWVFSGIGLSVVGVLIFLIKAFFWKEATDGNGRRPSSQGSVRFLGRRTNSSSITQNGQHLNSLDLLDPSQPYTKEKRTTTLGYSAASARADNAELRIDGGLYVKFNKDKDNSTNDNRDE